MTRQAEVFRRQAEYCDTRSPLYAELCRRCADEPLVREIAPNPRWDVPLRLLGGVHYLALANLAAPFTGDDPWPAFRATLAEYREWLARFVEEQAVQTNEVQRSWALLPAFLVLAREQSELDLIELGPSAGLNLVWDRYRYEYETGGWGNPAARLTLRGEGRRPPPAELLATRVDVRRRRGIDLDPVDVTSEHGARLLQAFVWADQRERLERLRRAIEILRDEPPELVRGDYLELLPQLLAKRDESALTVVFQTASTAYLSADQRERLRRTLDEAGAAGELAWLSTRAESEQEEDHHDGYELELGRWPPGERRLAARFDFHGAWLEWRG